MRFLSEIEYILNQLNIYTAYGTEHLRQLKPYKIAEAEALVSRLDDLEALIGSLAAHPMLFSRIEGELCRLKDIRGSIKKGRSKAVLDEIQLFEIKLFSMGASNIKYLYEKIGVKIGSVSFGQLEAITEILDPDGHRLPTFSIYDAYSEGLKQTRERKRSVERSMYSTTDAAELSKLKELRLSLSVEEELLERNVLSEISLKLLPHMDVLEEACNSIGLMDFTIAKAKLAVEGSCTKPIFSCDAGLQMQKGRHPYVEDVLRGQNKAFTPIDIELMPGANAITGPNMGGKSVSLKAVALNTLLAHLGFFVFAEKFRLQVFDFIHVLANDYESFKGGLSSFGGEVIQLNKYIEDIKRTRGLLLVDEFASGTNPQEGRLLVKALIEYLNQFNSISLLITHFDNVLSEGINHYQVVGLKRVDFKQLANSAAHDPGCGLSMLQGLMDYSLEAISQEVKVPKDALNISTLLGLDPEIIKTVNSYYCKEV